MGSSQPSRPPNFAVIRICGRRTICVLCATSNDYFYIALHYQNHFRQSVQTVTNVRTWPHTIFRLTFISYPSPICTALSVAGNQVLPTCRHTVEPRRQLASLQPVKQRLLLAAGHLTEGRRNAPITSSTSLSAVPQCIVSL